MLCSADFKEGSSTMQEGVCSASAGALGCVCRGAVDVRLLLKSLCTSYFEAGSFISERTEAY